MYSMIQGGTAQDRTGLDKTGLYNIEKIATCRDGLGLYIKHEEWRS